MNGKSITRLKSQRGIAMMVALLALLLLAAIGMGLMFMADTENSVNNNYRDSQKAYFAARAGAEQARLLLAADANTKGKAFGLDGHMPSSVLNTGMIYLMNPTSGEAIVAGRIAFDRRVGGEPLSGRPALLGKIYGNSAERRNWSLWIERPGRPAVVDQHILY